MDEYSPKRHDIAQLKFLCKNLFDESMSNLTNSYHGWVNDPTSKNNLQLNHLIEHIASFTMNYKIKYAEDETLITQIDDYLDDTFILFTNYGINAQELNRWQNSALRVFNIFKEECSFLQQPSQST
ncbi:Hha toxicity modulator TomB [Pantoea sp. Nvir]|uniref:Hha toxicity modulator TomB n=1 Tax=Pantoea sp. Nvir TaxID=2576760 RepID=UPI00135BAD02|nr:Hha toxicity modulator TomB [Pantoea sp. Nvir]MXP66367.1 Hha toxicity modulator TomB [Pantoea sp. Nvir]CAJ0993079.1 Hha toxicity modulator TomB [Pantoea sp. Nvir]